MIKDTVLFVKGKRSQSFTALTVKNMKEDIVVYVNLYRSSKLVITGTNCLNVRISTIIFVVYVKKMKKF